MTGALVFLHGHDDDPARWAGAAGAMAPAGWAVTCPTGPVPTGGGRAAWFGIDDTGEPDPAGVDAALDALDGHLRAAAGPDGATTVALAGFSQGGALALLHHLRRPGDDVPTPTSVAVLAGWLPDVAGLAPDLSPRPGTRLLVAHGHDDEVVPAPLGRSVARLLERQGHAVTFVSLDTGHDPTPFAGHVRSWLADT